MEKHKCKLCFRSFSNGRALGGHMRSHVMNHSKQEEESSRTVQLSFEAESSSSLLSSSTSPSSASSEEEEDIDDNDDDIKDVCSVLKENPKRSITEFSSSVILQDRESETESSKNNPTRKRSKRVWEIRRCDYTNNNNKTESWIDHEQVSSVSDTTTEEDVAFCLMMLSRDKWKTQKDQQEEEEQQEEDDEIERSLEESYESRELKKNQLRKGRYKCETCDKVFRSYQALGGHRASHKKIKMSIKVDHETEFEGVKMVEKKIHECPVCLRVFSSGQALGGHKRTHVTGSSNTTITTTTVPIFSSSKRFIDLNLPAPIDYDDDDISQFENSAVSDAEFIKTG